MLFFHQVSITIVQVNTRLHISIVAKIFIAATAYNQVGFLIVVHIDPACINIFVNAIFIKRGLWRPREFTRACCKKNSTLCSFGRAYKISSRPSPFISPIARAGPSVDTM